LLYLADGNPQQVRVYDFQSQAKVDELQLGLRPIRFEPFNSNSFLLNSGSRSSEPMLLLQVLPKNRLVFVPTGE
jgi:hypothetical protein